MQVEEVAARHTGVGVGRVVAAAILAFGQVVPGRAARSYVQTQVLPALRIVGVVAERVRRVAKDGLPGLGDGLDDHGGRVLYEDTAPHVTEPDLEARLMFR